MANKVIAKFHQLYKHVGNTHLNFWGAKKDYLIPLGCLACGCARSSFKEFVMHPPVGLYDNSYLCSECGQKEHILTGKLLKYQTSDGSLIKLAKKPIYDEVERIKKIHSKMINESMKENLWKIDY
jgi:hypothetical protein